LKTEPPEKSMKEKSKKKKGKGLDKEDKVKTGRKSKKKTDKEALAKPKTKPKRKPKPSKAKKVPTTARKIALTGKARKLPIEEADDVEIDWSDESSEKDQALEDFERARMDEQMKYLEREKINLFNELTFMKHDLDQKTKLVEDLTDDYDKLRNDFDSYKKRIRGDIKNKMKFASEKLISELLEVLDNFERTYAHDVSNIDKEDIIKGVKIINNQLMDILKKDGLSPIEAKGEP
jgi:molecular chaperone GrpE